MNQNSIISNQLIVDVWSTVNSESFAVEGATVQVMYSGNFPSLEYVEKIIKEEMNVSSLDSLKINLEIEKISQEEIDYIQNEIWI